MTKRSFLGNHDDAFIALFETADNAYLPLYKEWIYPLWRAMFRHIGGFSTTLEGSYGHLLWAREHNDVEMIEECTESFQCASEKADKLVVYAEFRKVLLS